MDGSSQPHGGARPLSIAIVAMGGQGGGVLAGWIAAAAEASGFTTQTTSVPGVAQRTGATIYYLELIRQRPDGKPPVLALMPVPGDVDLVIASEWMETGRAILRGLVTPDRTTLIASSHRAYAVAEKEQPGDGTADAQSVHEASEIAARRRIVADFARIAERAGSAISASLLGAVAASGALPIGREAFETALRASAVGGGASLRAFGAGFAEVRDGAQPPAGDHRPAKILPEVPDRVGIAELDVLLDRLRGDFPAATHRMIYAGLRHVVDFQDPAYGAEYLDRLAPVAVAERAQDGAARGFPLTSETARQLARAMAYDDVIRVADLKTRSSRRDRVEAELGFDPQRQVVQTTEFFHPRMEEICATLPAWLGGAIERRPWLWRMLDTAFCRGRRVRTDTILGYLQLHLVASRRTRRRGTLRHGRETMQIESWLDRVTRTASRDPELALELARCRALIKGYSDTMARELSKFDRVLRGADMVAQRPDAADWVRRLRAAALLDENGAALDGALKTLATLDDIPETGTTSHQRSRDGR